MSVKVAKARPLSSVVRSAPSCALLILVAGVMGQVGGCAKKADEKPAGLAPMEGAQPAPQAASPSTPGAAPAAPAAAAPAPPTAPVAAEGAPSGPPIEGSIDLAPARKKDVTPTDTIFLVARTVSDTPGIRGSLVAVKRFTAEKFPIVFKIGPEDMMFRGGAFAGELTLSARVDKDVDPMTRKKGDVFGTADHVKVGAKGVKVVLSELQKEDESLLGSTTMPPHAGAPSGAPHAVPGLPPGHP